jgi:hypothetical protein
VKFLALLDLSFQTVMFAPENVMLFVVLSAPSNQSVELERSIGWKAAVIGGKLRNGWDVASPPRRFIFQARYPSNR